jgi:hypothetical protein
MVNVQQETSSVHLKGIHTIATNKFAHVATHTKKQATGNLKNYIITAASYVSADIQ